MRKALSLALALGLVTTPLAPAHSQYVLNLREADIRAFIEDAARVTGRTFVMDPGVQGKVSVVTQRPLSRQYTSHHASPPIRCRHTPVGPCPKATRGTNGPPTVRTAPGSWSRTHSDGQWITSM